MKDAPYTRETLLADVPLSVRAHNLANVFVHVDTATIASLAGLEWPSVVMAARRGAKPVNELRALVRSVGLDFRGAPVDEPRAARNLPGSRPTVGVWVVRHVAIDAAGALVRIEHESGKPRLAVSVSVNEARRLVVGGRMTLHLRAVKENR